MPQVSHSRLSCFESCPLQYRYKYIEGREAAKGEGIEAFMGSRVHEALEKLYTDLRHERLLTEDDLAASFNREWERLFTDDIVIVKDYTAENYRAMGEKALRTYYRRFHPFKHAVTLATEKRISISLDPSGAYELIGFMDRLDKVDDSTYEVHDYKTSGTLPDQGKVDADRQLALYSLAVRREFPKAKRIRLIWHYLLFGVERESERTEEQLEQLRKDTLELAKSIERTEAFPARVSALCSWCEFQPICPEWAHKFKIAELEPGAYHGEEGVSLVNRYSQLSEKKSEVEGEIERLRQALFEYGEREHVNTVFGTDVQARLWRKETVKLPDHDDPRREALASTLKILGRFNDVSELNTWELAKVISERRWPQNILDQLRPFCRTEEVRRIYLNRRDGR